MTMPRPHQHHTHVLSSAGYVLLGSGLKKGLPKIIVHAQEKEINPQQYYQIQMQLSSLYQAAYLSNVSYSDSKHQSRIKSLTTDQPPKVAELAWISIKSRQQRSQRRRAKILVGILHENTS